MITISYQYLAIAFPIVFVGGMAAGAIVLWWCAKRLAEADDRFFGGT